MPRHSLPGCSARSSRSSRFSGLSFRAGDWNLYRLLLTGVVFSAGCSALISLLLALAPEAQLKGMLFWLMGDLSAVASSGWAWPVLIVLGAVRDRGRRGAQRAEPRAQQGAHRSACRWCSCRSRIYFAACARHRHRGRAWRARIGFVGLIVPHLVRLLGVTDHRWLIPSALLCGGALLTIADTAARTVWAPLQIPVGVFTALLGVPVVLVLLAKRR